MKRLVYSLALACFFIFSGAEAQEKGAAAARPAAAAFNAKLEEWKSVLKDLRKVKTQFSLGGEEERKKFQEQWDQLIAKGNQLLPDLRQKGLAAYQEAPNEDAQLARFLAKMAADAAATDDYGTGYAIAQVMLENNSDLKELWSAAALGAFINNDYAKAEEYFKKGDEAKAIDGKAKEMELHLADYKKLWENEEAIRKAEAEKDDLPRVKLETSKGTIVVELFENEAPNTVANFISLVEKGFYNGLTFHRVLPNFMAQGGCPKGDGTGGPEYNIPCECYQENYRRHFAGTLSMAHAGRDTGGSQFFLTFVPTPNLNGRHTAFGRVIEGMDVLAKIQRRDPQGSPPLPTPDKIVKATVVRKRDHAYEPKKAE